jgi:hypothetical protein
MNKRKLPKTDSIQELASFWDTHDLTDFEDQLEEVNEPVFGRRSSIDLHLQANEAEAVQELARSKGISGEQLIREWVRQKLTRRNRAGSSKRGA